MDTQQIEFLREAIKAGSLSRAADNLNLNQSILSRQIAALERELGCALIRRHGRGVVVTAEGLRLLELSQTFLHEVSMLRSNGSSGELKGTFTLGVPMFLSQSIAPQLISRIRRLYPNVALLLREGHSGDLYDWLLSSELSATVIYDSKRPRQFAVDDLFLEPFSVVGSAEFAKRLGLATDGSLRLAELASLPLLLPTQRHGTRLDLDRIMKQHDLVPNIVYEVDALGARMLLVREGMGVTIFESSGLSDVRRDRSLFVMPMAEALNHKLIWVDGKGAEQGPQWRAFVSQVKREIIQLRKEVVI